MERPVCQLGRKYFFCGHFSVSHSQQAALKREPLANFSLPLPLPSAPYNTRFHIILLRKVYVENHRVTTDIPVSRLKEIKGIIEEYGVQVSGGITSTVLLNDIQKPSLFDTFCYSDPAHRAEYLRIVREDAEVFDEIILDDFFFTYYDYASIRYAHGAEDVLFEELDYKTNAT